MSARGRSKWLANKINEKGYTRGAEIGVAIGLTTKHVLNSCPGLEVYTVVDIWKRVPGSGIFDRDDMKQVFLREVGGDARLEVLEGISWEMAVIIPDKSIDFAFIDAAHDYESVKKDIRAWGPKIRKGGMLCGHDIHWDGVKKAVDELCPGYKVVGIDNCWVLEV